MFLKKKRISSFQTPSKIEVFSRHCYHSTISQHKERFLEFSREKCFDNFLKTIDPQRANITYFLDAPQGKEHFIHSFSYSGEKKIVQFEAGSEATSFLYLLEYITAQSFDPDTIIYIVEDDYLHRPGWVDLLFEGFSIPDADYVTLYDHRDKYFDVAYKKTFSKLFVSQKCHWRTTPSTTNTFAVRFRTLLEDQKIHRRYSQNRIITLDHKKFIALRRRGRTLISSIPGWSTHVEPKFASPCLDWNLFLEERCLN